MHNDSSGPEFPAQPPIPRRQGWRAQQGVVLALVMGLALSVLAFFTLYTWERERAQAEFSRATEGIAANIERCAHHQVDNLFALGAFFNTFPAHIDYQAFRAFSHPLTSHCAALLTLHWIPHVTQAERTDFEARAQRLFPGFQVTAPDAQGRLVRAGPRTEYFPILYLEPLQKYRSALGFDVASRPGRYRALQRARDTGRMTIVNLQNLIPYPSGASIQVMFYPVYEPGAAVDSVEERRAKLRGMAAAVFQMSEIVTEALRSAGNPVVDVHVYQILEGGHQDLLYTYQAPSARTGLQAASLHPAERMSLSHSFKVGDDTWSLVVVSAAGTNPALRSWLPWSGLVAGLLGTLLLIGHWRASLAHTARVEKLAGALLQTNQSHNALIQAVPLPIIAIDREHTVIRWNPAAEKMFGWRADEVLGQPLPIVPETAREAFAAEIAGEFTGAEMPAGVEMQRQRKDGSLVEVRRWTAPVRDAEGKIVGIMGIFEDITERKRMEEALQLSEARLRAAIGAAPIVVFNQDRELRYTWIQNPMLGLPAQILGKRDAELFEPAEAERLEAIKREVLACGMRARHEARLHFKGTEHFFDLTLEPLCDKQGAAVGLLGVAIDITEHRRLQNQLAEQAERLAEADRRKDEFLALLAHELRNPLAPIANAVEVLHRRSGPHDPVVKWAEGVIGRQVEQLGRLVDDLLDVARITSGRIQLRKERVALADILTRAVDTVRPLIDARYHTLTINLPAEPISLEADPARLAQVLVNLLDNAARYTPEEGRITLTAEQEGKEAVIRVEDNGKGILPEVLARIFEPFSNIAHPWRRSQGEGLGLGLSVARRLVELHGGGIAAESAGLGRGSTFTVRLPLAAPAPPAPPAPAPAAPAARRILVIEDNPDVAESFAVLLRTLGHAVEVAGDGAAGLAAVRRDRPDLVFLDIGLPDLDGYAVARRLREEHGAGLPLVALTGYGQEADRQRARAAGFDRHLLKPVRIEELEAILAAVQPDRGLGNPT